MSMKGLGVREFRLDITRCLGVRNTVQKLLVIASFYESGTRRSRPERQCSPLRMLAPQPDSRGTYTGSSESCPESFQTEAETEGA